VIEYIITTHLGLPGVGLAKVGEWGNVRHDDDASALDAIDKDAKGKPFTVLRVMWGGRLIPVAE